MDNWTNVKSSGGNGGGMTGNCFFVPGASNSENRSHSSNFFLYRPGQFKLIECGLSYESVCCLIFMVRRFTRRCTVLLGRTSNGSVDFHALLHVEDSDATHYGSYIPFLGVSSDLSTSIHFDYLEVANDGNWQAIVLRPSSTTAVSLVSTASISTADGGGTVTPNRHCTTSTTDSHRITFATFRFRAEDSPILLE